MTAGLEEHRGPEADADSPDGGSDVRAALRQMAGAFRRFDLAVAAVVIVQSAWLAVLVSRGWFFEADFANLASSRGPLTLGFLTESQGGHLVIGDRFVYWVLVRTVGLEHGPIVALTVIAQAVVTILLARLLVLLVGRRPGVIAVLALVAVSPLMIQTLVWATASIAVLPGLAFGILAMGAHVRYALTRRLRSAFAASGWIVAAVLFSEQSAVVALAFPFLTFGFLATGGVRDRLRAVLRAWPEYVVLATPVLLFVGYFFSSGKFAKQGQTGVHPADALHVVWVEFTQALFPGMIGGPFVWFRVPDNLLQLSQPAVWLQWVAGLVVLALVAWSVRRTSWYALVAWAMPLVVIGVGIAVVAVGRYEVLGVIIAQQMEHTCYVIVPLAVAVCLALWPDHPDAVCARLLDVEIDDLPVPETGRPTSRGSRAGAITVVIVVLAGSVISAVTYTNHWSDSYSRRYVDTLRASLRSAGSSVSLFDTDVSTRVVPALVPHRKVSDLLALMDEDVRMNAGSNPRVVDSTGRIVPASFFRSASVDTSGSNPLCNAPIRGTTEVVRPLSSTLRRNEWFLRIGLFQRRPSVLDVTARDRDGRVLEPVGGRRVVVTDSLAVAYVQFPAASISAVSVRGTTDETLLCLTSADVGFPYPTGGGP